MSCWGGLGWVKRGIVAHGDKIPAPIASVGIHSSVGVGGVGVGGVGTFVLQIGTVVAWGGCTHAVGGVVN